MMAWKIILTFGALLLLVAGCYDWHPFLLNPATGLLFIAFLLWTAEEE